MYPNNSFIFPSVDSAPRALSGLDLVSDGNETGSVEIKVS
jgi:hypothetical protein